MVGSIRFPSVHSIVWRRFIFLHGNLYTFVQFITGSCSFMVNCNNEPCFIYSFFFLLGIQGSILTVQLSKQLYEPVKKRSYRECNGLYSAVQQERTLLQTASSRFDGRILSRINFKYRFHLALLDVLERLTFSQFICVSSVD